MNCTPYSPSVSVLSRLYLAPRGPLGSSRSFSAACASWNGPTPDGCAAPASIDSFLPRPQPAPTKHRLHIGRPGTVIDSLIPEDNANVFAAAGATRAVWFS